LHIPPVGATVCGIALFEKRKNSSRSILKPLGERSINKKKLVICTIMPKSLGFRRKTRSVLRAKPRSPLGALLQDYRVGDRVVIDIDSRQTKGMPHRRFQGTVGTVEEVRRRSIVVLVPVGGKTKQVIARFEHVKPLGTKS
jgi:large subunit ribosomal protein L21e